MFWYSTFVNDTLLKYTTKRAVYLQVDTCYFNTCTGLSQKIRIL